MTIRAAHCRAVNRPSSFQPPTNSGMRKIVTSASSANTICDAVRWLVSGFLKYASETQMTAATATTTTEKRSIRLDRPAEAAACLFVVRTAIVITPLAAGAEIGRTVSALRRPSFIPTVRSAPEWALRLHRVMRRRALAGFTADQGVTPLPRRPRPDYQVASAGARAAERSRGSRPRQHPGR